MKYHMLILILAGCAAPKPVVTPEIENEHAEHGPPLPGYSPQEVWVPISQAELGPRLLDQIARVSEQIPDRTAWPSRSVKNFPAADFPWSFEEIERRCPDRILSTPIIDWWRDVLAEGRYVLFEARNGVPPGSYWADEDPPTYAEAIIFIVIQEHPADPATYIYNLFSLGPSNEADLIAQNGKWPPKTHWPTVSYTNNLIPELDPCW